MDESKNITYHSAVSICIRMTCYYVTRETLDESEDSKKLYVTTL